MLREFQLLPHVSCAALSGLMAIGVAAGRPENAGKEDADDYGYDDEWGSDIHGGQILHYPDYQRGNRRLWLSGNCARGEWEACGFIMNPPAFCS
jgi:hypothetical protein